MQYPLRILIVEDRENWRKALREHFRANFKTSRVYREPEIDTAEDGDQALAFLQANRRYDLVALDMKLGERVAGAPPPSGLDVLEEIEARGAAFFVALITGAATDPTMVETYGREDAAVMQVGLQCEAAKHFPPDRIRVVNKPPQGSFKEQWSLTAAAIDEVLKAFEQSSEWRYVFRPLRKKGKVHWELRWDGEHYVRIPADPAGFAEIRYILQSVDSDDQLSVVEMMARVQETITRTRGGSRKKADHLVTGKEENPSAKIESPFPDIMHLLEKQWQDEQLDSEAITTFHEYLGTQQLDKLCQALKKRAATSAENIGLTDAIDKVVQEDLRRGAIFPGQVRLVPARSGKLNDDGNMSKDHKNKLDTFRQQWSRVQSKLQECGLDGMAEHFKNAIPRGKFNPGLCPYDISRAVRWKLD